MVTPVFDRRAVRLHRDRSARAPEGADFLLREVAERLADRLDDMRETFPLALDVGARQGLLGRTLRGRGGVETLVAMEPSGLLCRAGSGPRVVADEDWLPFAGGRFDLVLSSLLLHWSEDLPGVLAQIRRALRPGGLFLAALFGGETLAAFRRDLLAAEALATGGAAPRVSPFVDLREAAGLLQRAGFSLPVADIDGIEVTYETPFALMADLRAMGETSALAARPRHFSRRGLFAALAAGRPEGERLSARFEVVFMTGWA